jgi:hypothetical protein
MQALLFNYFSATMAAEIQHAKASLLISAAMDFRWHALQRSSTLKQSKLRSRVAEIQGGRDPALQSKQRCRDGSP